MLRRTHRAPGALYFFSVFSPKANGAVLAVVLRLVPASGYFALSFAFAAEFVAR